MKDPVAKGGLATEKAVGYRCSPAGSYVGKRTLKTQAKRRAHPGSNCFPASPEALALRRVILDFLLNLKVRANAAGVQTEVPM